MSKKTRKTERGRNEAALEKYAGKQCRIFLKNGMCLTGTVHYAGGEWLELEGNTRGCTINVSNIDCIGER